MFDVEGEVVNEPIDSRDQAPTTSLVAVLFTATGPTVPPIPRCPTPDVLPPGLRAASVEKLTRPPAVPVFARYSIGEAPEGCTPDADPPSSTTPTTRLAKSVSGTRSFAERRQARVRLNDATLAGRLAAVIHCRGFSTDSHLPAGEDVLLLIFASQGQPRQCPSQPLECFRGHISPGSNWRHAAASRSLLAGNQVAGEIDARCTGSGAGNPHVHRRTRWDDGRGDPVVVEISKVHHRPAHE
jgi:hypothetical protein